jgi:prevent-host-death family protein
MARKNTIIVGMHEAKSQLSKLVRQVEAGDEVIVSNGGRPVVKIVKYEAPKEPRKPGLWKGRIKIHDDFDDPLPGFEIFYEDPPDGE